jgi:hypothetical protein
MTKRSVFMTVVAAAVSGAAVMAVASAQTQPGPAPYNYGLGDLMNTVVQPRHAKLGLAARDQNWPLAEYALHELKSSFANIGRSRPRFRNMPLPEMIETATGEPIRALEQAIKAGDAGQFADAYRKLTEGCNSCHMATNHSYVVIKAPEQSAFLNQDFRAAK